MSCTVLHPKHASNTEQSQKAHSKSFPLAWHTECTALGTANAARACPVQTQCTHSTSALRLIQPTQRAHAQRTLNAHAAKVYCAWSANTASARCEYMRSK
eukprot:scaffold70001_cov25-Tisochrysis_lutea.AAC.2